MIKGSGLFKLSDDRRRIRSFYEALISAETVPLKEFEKKSSSKAVCPLKSWPKEGKTMLFGPMKPVGLEDPKTGKRPYAVVQLRQDDAAGTLYNIVGFQTHLKWGDQRKYFV